MIVDMILAATTQPATMPADSAQWWTSLAVDKAFLGNSLLQWLGLLGVLLGGFVIGKVLSFILLQQSQRLAARRSGALVPMLLRSVSGPIMVLALAGGLYLAGTFMSLKFTTSGGTVVNVRGFWTRVCETLSVLAATWLVFRLVDVIELFLKRWTAKTDTAMDDQLVPLLRKTLRVFVVIVAALFIARNIFEWDIGALVAGLGIGGLAFALASKDMLSNLFGSITIFADRPFLMNERIKVGGYDGTVEEVGFRSTRIRLLSGHLVTVPNAIVANEGVENVSRRPYLKRVLDVTITYDTSPAKVQRAVDIIKEMLQARMEHFAPDTPPRVFFSDFNPASLNIVVYYWYAPPEWWDYLAFNHDFNMELLGRFNDEGIEFAFPTQTLHIKQDSPLNADIRLKPGSGEAYT